MKHLFPFRRPSSPPHVLMIHGWLRGNLGDFCITLQCLKGLHRLVPGIRIDLVSVGGPSAAYAGVLPFVERFMQHPYEIDLTGMFGGYAAVLNAPGGGLQNAGDARAPFILRDAAACAAAGIPHALCSHSLHPDIDLSPLRGSLVVAREPRSAALARQAGLRVAEAADLAFLQRIPLTDRLRPRKNRVLLFLRFDHFTAFDLDGRTLRVDDRTYALPPGELILASSDPGRDDPLLTRLAARWGIRYEPSLTLDHLLRFITTASHVISDRYHPVIFSRMAGVPYTFMKRAGSLRDDGLEDMLGSAGPASWRAGAEHGLRELAAFIR